MRMLKRLQGEDEGQAIIMVALAMGFFLIAAVGLGIDGSHLYSQHQMAQIAADSAAQAAMMSIFDGTNASGTAQFSTASSFTCGTTDAKTPCVYARDNGFGGSAADTVKISFPTTAPAGVSLSSTYPVNLVNVQVSRQVSTFLVRFAGATATTVNATATAAIVTVQNPVPILVNHPTLQNSLSLQGTPNIQICGGPSKSIQVNSDGTYNGSKITSASDVLHTGGSAAIDLSKAGPLDSGSCTTGTGASIGVWGPPSNEPGGITLGVGKYVQPASPVPDPLATVSAPPLPTNSGKMGTSEALGNGVSGCPASPKKACQLYYPGLYTGGIDGKNSTPVFIPGIYYIQSSKGMSCAANCDMYMATGLSDTYTGTGWTGNVLFYNTGPAGNASNAGAFNLGANGSIFLTGSPTSSIYKGILLFQDHASQAQSHSLGGGGALQLIGTIYMTNTKSTMLATPSKYQSVSLSGNSGSSTTIQGEIIVDSLTLGGTGGVTMNLSSTSYPISQVALVQ